MAHSQEGQQAQPQKGAQKPADNIDNSQAIVPNYWDFRSIGTPPSAEDLGSIRVLMSDDFPPFSYMTRDNRLAGFHVDFTKAICLELKVSCTILVRPFNQLTEALAAGKGDAVMAGLSVQAASQENLLLSDVYLTTPGRFVRRKAAGSLDKILGGKMGVVGGTTH
ncbi:MAG: transporter substrate-binding domain-containing protein, partial [Rhizobiales bacterium]|nr:transporter substrate-binding domain-containing protein [Hyphomicrobiales bacterium]